MFFKHTGDQIVPMCVCITMYKNVLYTLCMYKNVLKTIFPVNYSFLHS